MEIFECQQGTDEWKQVKLGHISTSNFDKVLNKGAGRKLYMRKLAAERLSGIWEESYHNSIMGNGELTEQYAREYYEMLNDCDVRQIGFVSLDGWVGSSPDGLVGEAGLIEIKCPLRSTHIETLLKEKMPTCYVSQVQGQLWVTGRKWCDFISYAPLMNTRPFYCKRIFRDEEYIESISKQIQLFADQLRDMINQVTNPSF